MTLDVVLECLARNTQDAFRNAGIEDGQLVCSAVLTVVELTARRWGATSDEAFELALDYAAMVTLDDGNEPGT